MALIFIQIEGTRESVTVKRLLSGLENVKGIKRISVIEQAANDKAHSRTGYAMRVIPKAKRNMDFEKSVINQLEQWSKTR